MFNLFNKKKEENPISNMLSDLSTNQKMSFMNLLLLVGSCDGDQSDQDKELQFLNSYVDMLNVRSDKSMAYLNSYGYQRIIDDLKTISKSQKEFMIAAAWDMIICDGRPNETEVNFTGAIFEKLGVSKEEFVGTIEKTQAIMKYFFEK